MDGVDTAPGLPLRSSGWSARLAGALTVLLGSANALFAVLALTTDLVRFSPATSGSLLVLGVVTIALGVLVWRGSRVATTIALVVFGLVLALQVVELAAEDGAAGSVAVRLVVLAVLVLALLRARFARDGGAGRA